ncbi:MAG TPA: glutathione S-transferase [Amaricoccus sp.]|nr:glutathione S-transferase [Amaricoccus sp.]
MAYVLAIGDRAYSSWSLRGWLPFARFGLPVTLRLCRLYAPEFAATLAEGFGIARTVPALRIEDGPGDGPGDRPGDQVVLWDSLAIAETLAERHPGLGLWPEPPAARAMARALAAEMHSGFAALRSACPMNLRRSYAGFEADAAVRADLARIEALWSAARSAHGGTGPWLFGTYSLADVFFAPVAARVATYGLPVGPAAMAYVEAHLADAAFRAWRAEGLADPVVQATYDLDLPERPWPGPA